MIQLRNLVKSYGDKLAVNNISLDVPQGQLVGYLGPNGAGKSTTVKILTGMIKPTSGSATVCGKDTVRDNMAVKEIVGYVPESGAVFESLTGMEYLHMVGRLRHLSEAAIKERVTKFSEFFELPMETLDEETLAGYSKGMRQKVVITAALLHNPSIVFFDEPLNGLDSNMALMFKELLRSLAHDGKTIFFCSHILDVVERICERIVIINSGTVIADGTSEELLKRTGEKTLEEAFNRLTINVDLRSKAQEFSKKLA